MEVPRIRRGEVVVVGLGGNAIMDAKGKAPFDEQRAATRVTMRSVAELIEKGHTVVLTHGNGPIVGNIMIRGNAASDQIPAMPLEVCVADSIGGLGYMIQQSLQNELTARGVKRSVVTIVTQVLVDLGDPALQNPSKPIGPSYNKAEAGVLEREKKWRMIEDSGRGYRRTVPSPKPVSIVEAEVIRILVESGVVVIAVGGGGVPVIRTSDALLQGIDAVIDKDWAALLLARQVGARHLVLLTSVEKVALHYQKPNQVDLDRLEVREANRYLREDEFPAGSMGPKIAASVAFLRGGGAGVLITSPGHLIDGLEGRTGTWIVPDFPPTC